MNLRRALELPWHPFLVAILPLVQFYENNFEHVAPGDGLRLALLYAALAGLLLLAARRLWGDAGRGALVIVPLVAVIVAGKAMGGAVSIGLLAAALILAAVLLRFRIDLAPATVMLNVMTLVLVIMPLYGTYQAAKSRRPPIPKALAEQVPALKPPADGSIPPDIYYIMVDGFGQPDFLQAAYRVPKTATSGLFEALGFTVAERSRAHYPQTALSQSSTLNMAYVSELLEAPDPKSKDRRQLGRLIGHSRVRRALEGLGYRTVSYPSGYPITRMSDVDRRRRPTIDPNMLEYHVLDKGVLPLLQPLLGRGPADLSYAMRRGRLDYILDELPDARRGIAPEDPVFVYVHLMAPHPPFVFGEHGEALPSRQLFSYSDGNHWHHWHTGDALLYKRLYHDQAIYVSGRLAAAVAAIIESSPRPPVIVIQGDHGPGDGTKWHSVRETNQVERLSIFNAWYVPGGVPAEFRADLGAINTFPVLLNALFDADLPEQSESFWFARWDQPFVPQPTRLH